MSEDILIIGVLFPAIPLMMINFGNRYTALSALIRSLHDQAISESHQSSDNERMLQQIKTIRMRLQLVRIIQTCAGFSFMLTLSAMIAIYFGAAGISSTMFLSAILLMALSMLLFIFELQIANSALDVHLSDIEEFKKTKK